MIIRKILTAVLLLAGPLSVYSQTCTLAVAANAHDVLEVLAGKFSTEYHLEVKLVTGASGTLSTQIRNGAPFDLFLSADTLYPGQLYRDGLTTGRPVVYARGSLVLCSTTQQDLGNWVIWLGRHTEARLAVADPQAAPYGRAATEFMQHEHLTGRIKPSIVYGTSISQVNLYISTGTVAMGFTSLSYVREREARHLPVYYSQPAPSTYRPIDQAMVLLKSRDPSSELVAEKFFTYLQKDEARQVLRTYGYH